MKSRSNPIFIEFKENSVHVLDGAENAEFPLERESNGRITAASRAAIANGLRGFLQRNGVFGQRRAWCALPARGVTLRTFTLPASAKEDPRKLLGMQMEAQLPVPPSDLSWGFDRVRSSNGAAGNPNQAEFLVAAVRRELIEDYSALLSSCGIMPSFTVSALVRGQAANLPTAFGLLEVGMDRSELALFDERSIPSLRVVNWGHRQAGNPEGLRGVVGHGTSRLYVSGANGGTDAAVEILGSARAERLPINGAQGSTAAIEGLRRIAERNGPLILLGSTEEPSQIAEFPRHWKWAAAAVLLLLASLTLRYADALLFRSQLTTKLGELAKYRKSLPNLEREVSFLTFIKTNQPPYLDVVAVLSSAAPPGTRFDQLAIARRGDISVRGSVQDPQGPEKFRTKLIDSGFFSKVVVEEQGPASQQDRNKISFRVTAILKPDGARKELPPEPPLTNKVSGSVGSNQGSPPPGAEMPNMPVPAGAKPVRSRPPKT